MQGSQGPVGFQGPVAPVGQWQGCTHAPVIPVGHTCSYIHAPVRPESSHTQPYTQGPEGPQGPVTPDISVAIVISGVPKFIRVL